MTWEEKNVKLTQESEIPNSDTTKFTVEMLNDALEAEMKLYLRIPDWIDGSVVVKINGTKAEDVKTSSGYLVLDRTWQDSDEVEVQFPMTIRAYSLPDNDGTVYGFKYGPIVLAADLGSDDKMTTGRVGSCDVADTKIVNGREMKLTGGYGGTSPIAALSTETLNILNTSVPDFIANINDYLVKDSDSLSFTLRGTDYDGTLKFIPYYRINSKRYGIYWLFSEDADADNSQQTLAEKETGRDNRVALSNVGVGYTEQTEGSEEKGTWPCLSGTDSEKNESSTARRAKSGGSFSYLFKVDKTNKNYLVCKFAKEDNGKPIVITSNGITIVNTTLNYDGEEDIYTVTYEIPAAAVEGAQSYDYTSGAESEQRDVIRIAFEGTAESESAWVYNPAYTRTAYSTKAEITSLKYKTGNAQTEVAKDGSKYSITVPKTTSSLVWTAQLADQYGLLYVDEKLVDDMAEQTVELKNATTNVKLLVYAEDHETKKEYTLTITKQDDSSKPTQEPAGTQEPAPTSPAPAAPTSPAPAAPTSEAPAATATPAPAATASASPSPSANTTGSSKATTGSKASTKKKTLKLSAVKAKKGKKKITGKVSVKKATVKIKVGKKKYKKAKVSGKSFSLKTSKLKKGTKITIKVSKSGYKTLTKTYKVK